MAINHEFWGDRHVFVTGHTGFKGGWLVLWLQRLGAIVAGYSLAPPTEPNLYTVTCLKKDIRSTIADVCHLDQLKMSMKAANPEIAFHFAAQPLVRSSFAEPVYTYATNVMGTVNFLEAVRHTPSVRVAVVVTSDKCYENNNNAHAHVEQDPMGGSNPYASSKACAELITDAYRRSFFDKDKVAVATVRAGNVIGGGDWGKDRLIPDMIRAYAKRQVLCIRYPDAVRPWQHVLDPLNGYLQLAIQLWQHGADYAKGWNFGPTKDKPLRVKEIIRKATRMWGKDAQWEVAAEKELVEDKYLNIDASMAYKKLKWNPKLDIETSLQWTMAWYRAHLQGESNMRRFSLQQIEQYESII